MNRKSVGARTKNIMLNLFQGPFRQGHDLRMNATKRAAQWRLKQVQHDGLKGRFLCLGLFLTLAGCASSGHGPHAFKDAETGLYGYQGSSGVVVIPPQYQQAEAFDESGYAQVLNEDGEWVYIDKFGGELK